LNLFVVYHNNELKLLKWTEPFYFMVYFFTDVWTCMNRVKTIV
jgi:hypothetical protein